MAQVNDNEATESTDPLRDVTLLEGLRDTVNAYYREYDKWTRRAVKILKRYRDDSRDEAQQETARYNILWANVQTIIPAVFAKLPKAEVERRFRDNDPVARVAATLLERSLDFEVEHYPDFRATMTDSVSDRYTVGRGLAWARYEPHLQAQPGEPEDGVSVTEDVTDVGGGPGDAVPAAETPMGEDGAPLEQIEYECAPVDYVHWRDFFHNPARTWAEVHTVGRKTFMTQEQLQERFPDNWQQVALNTQPETLDTKTKHSQTASLGLVYEIWNKTRGEAYWYTEGYDQFLDRRPDPLGMEGFFPCPKPLYATLTTDTLVPVPDFIYYQDQAVQLDILADRIEGLVRALRIRGVYDSSQTALQRLFTEGSQNAMIPVDGWRAFSEKGGLKGAIDFVPIDMIAAALLDAYKAKAEIKGSVDELTGISDIIRGETQASETATAQRIKSNYANLRLKKQRDDVSIYASDLLRLKAHIIATKFSPQTILQYADADQLPEEDKALIPQALQLLKGGPMRTFRIQVAADSLVQLDEAQTKEDRNELVKAVGDYLAAMLPVVQAFPALLELVLEMLKFAISSYKEAKSVQGMIDRQLDLFKQNAQKAQANPQQTKPDPEMIRTEVDAASTKLRDNLEVLRTRAEITGDQQRLRNETQEAQARIVKTLRPPEPKVTP